MSEYIRTTRECSVRQLKPELLQAVQGYFREHQMGDLNAEAIICCETISRKKSTSKLISWLNGDSDTTVYTGMLLTPTSLIWIHCGDLSGTRLNAAGLNQIRVEYTNSRFTKDVGLEIVGYIGDSYTRVRGYIGMGAETAAQKFYDEVKQAVDRINPPAKKELFKWPGGQ